MADELVVVPNGDETAVVTETVADAEADNAGEATTEVNANEQSDEERHKRLGGWQRKIQKLEREKEALNEALLALKPKGAPKEETKAEAKTADPEPEPSLDDYNDYDAYQKDLRAWDRREVKRELAQEAADKVAAEQKQAQQTTVAQQWDKRMATARKEHADFDEVAFNPDVMEIIKDAHALANAVTESELGAEIAYELGKNPAEAARIAKLTPARQFMEVGKLEARLAKEKPAEEAGEQPATPISSAPKPIQPARKSSRVDDGELRDDLSPAEWNKRYLARLEKAKK